MKPRLAACLTILIVFAGVLLLASPVMASPPPSVSLPSLSPPMAQAWPEYPALSNHSIDRGPGGYFSWIKLLLIVVVYLVWVKLADLVNRDALKFEEHTGHSASIWNPIILLSFVGGLVAAISIPLFVAGFATYFLAAFLPVFLYAMNRRGKVPEEARTGELFSTRIEQTGGPVTFKAAGNDSDESQSNLIRARQSHMFEATSTMLHEAFSKRTEQILFDYTRDAVTGREQVDGIWHGLPTLDRVSGDAMLIVLKALANLNAGERRQTQRGRFDARIGRHKVGFDLLTQGVPTGERALLKLVYESTQSQDLGQLGMPEPMVVQLNKALHKSCLLIISAPFGQGLSTTWQAMLGGADRFTRDWISIVDHDDQETDKENIDVKRFDSRAGESPATILKKSILKQPDVFVVPNPVNAETMDLLIDQIMSDKRTVMTHARANTAAEALLRVMSLGGDRKGFAKSVSLVTCQRLVRRLCDTCKQPIQANPKAIAQMGGNPAAGTTLYRHYVLPPVEQRIGEDGKPIEMLPCKACAGIGFQGRTAIYEMVVVDEEIRKVLLTQPQIEPVTKIIRQRGNLTLQEQAYRAVLDGRTSLDEVQRVMQGQPNKPSKS